MIKFFTIATVLLAVLFFTAPVQATDDADGYIEDYVAPYGVSVQPGFIFTSVWVENGAYPQGTGGHLYTSNGNDGCRNVQGIGTTSLTVTRTGCDTIYFIRAFYNSVACTALPHIKDAVPAAGVYEVVAPPDHLFTKLWLKSTYGYCFTDVTYSSWDECYADTGVGTNVVRVHRFNNLCPPIAYIQVEHQHWTQIDPGGPD